MTTLKEIKSRLSTVIEQITNERLTGDSFTDYKIRYQTSELCDERNRLNQLAFDKHGIVL